MMSSRNGWGLLVIAVMAVMGCESTADLPIPGGGSGGTSHTGGSTSTAGTGGEAAAAATGGGGSGGTGAMGGGGGAGGTITGPCNVGDCSDCGSSDCAYALCEADTQTCANNSACVALSNCLFGCTDPDCEQQCHVDHAAGSDDYYAVLNCLYCSPNTCFDDCEPVCPLAPPPPAPCDVGDCSSCGSSDCAYFWCGVELQACFNSAECASYESCELGCGSDPTCIQGCRNTHSTGAALYYAVLNCLYCDIDTCSQDCAAYCPIEMPPDPPCDVGDCSSCGSSDCAYFWCGIELDTCINSAECLNYEGCEIGCAGDPACIKACGVTYPTGVVQYYDVLDCLYCDANTCATDCAPYCPISPPPDAPCDTGDCSACGSSDCAYFWCGLELDACLNDPECLNYESCEMGCAGDPLCIQGCLSSYPTGSTLYYDLLNCLYCDTNTCSVDCAPYCPITPLPTGPCDVGDCGTCANSSCASALCAVEIQACSNNPDCVNLANCYSGCSNPGCYHQCDNQFPGGIADYDAMLSCLMCDPSTCSVDCAPYCP